MTEMTILQPFSVMRHPDESQDPLAAALRFRGDAAANGSRISDATRGAGMTKKKASA